MRLPESRPVNPDVMWAFLVAALNGNLELGENLAYAVSGTFDVAADTAKDFGHALNRVPKWLWASPTSDLTGLLGWPGIYWLDADKDGFWTPNSIRLRCQIDTSGTDVQWRGWLI